MDEFAVGEDLWVERLANLRNSVRQELIARQLGEHVHNGSRVLDVGCGQGTQAIRLAQRGCDVVGVDPSTDLLARLAADADSAGVRVSTHHGRLEDLAATVGRRRFDVVCAHGLLMYLDDPQKALATLGARVAPGGLLSVTFRNGGALAFRPGMRRRWQDAIEAFDASTYVNELGVRARAQRLDEIRAILTEMGLPIVRWYGVRVFADPSFGDEHVGDKTEFESLLAAEDEAGRRDPYRQMASQLHVIARFPNN